MAYMGSSWDNYLGYIIINYGEFVDIYGVIKMG